jgi:hypothetical protein
MKIEVPTDIEDVYRKFPELVPQKVNLNGSPKQYLLDDYIKVLNTLTLLQAQMGSATPHGRDYQTHSDPQAGTKARIAWSARRVFLKELEDDIRHCAEMVANQ